MSAGMFMREACDDGVAQEERREEGRGERTGDAIKFSSPRRSSLPPAQPCLSVCLASPGHVLP